MTNFLDWRLATIKNGMLDAIAYRMDFILGLVGSIIVPAGIQLTVWYSAFVLGGLETLNGQTYSQLLAYTAVSTLFSQIRGGNYDFELDEMITTGNLNNYLLRPVGAVEFVYLRSVGEKTVTTIVCLLVGFIASFFTSLNFANFALGMALAILGNVIHYQIGAVICVLSFYWEQAWSALAVKNMIVSLFSGELLPLSIFPAAWEPYWKALPFYMYVYGPAQIALGQWSTTMALRTMGIACVWIFVLNFVIRYSWRIAIRRYQGIGG